MLFFYSYSTHSFFTNFPFWLPQEAHHSNIHRFSSSPFFWKTCWRNRETQTGWGREMVTVYSVRWSNVCGIDWRWRESCLHNCSISEWVKKGITFSFTHSLFPIELTWKWILVNHRNLQVLCCLMALLHPLSQNCGTFSCKDVAKLANQWGFNLMLTCLKLVIIVIIISKTFI